MKSIWNYIQCKQTIMFKNEFNDIKQLLISISSNLDMIIHLISRIMKLISQNHCTTNL